MHTGPRTAVLAVRCSGSSAARTASAAPTGGPTWEPGEVTRACLQADAGHRPRDWKGTHPVPVDRDNAQTLAWAVGVPKVGVPKKDRVSMPAERSCGSRATRRPAPEAMPTTLLSHPAVDAVLATAAELLGMEVVFIGTFDAEQLS